MRLRMRLTVNQDVLEALRELPARAQRDFRRRLQTEFKPELQAQVDRLMNTPPGPVSSPFVFGTARSRRFWFYLISAGLVMTDGSHYIRQDIIERGFRVDISDRLRGNLITVTNIQPKAVFVYGPWIVPGHAVTGWSEQANIAHQLLQEWSIGRIIEMWYEAVQEAKRGRG